MAERRSVAREGVTAGLIGATVVAVWFLVFDLMAGGALQTPRLLGTAFFSLFGFQPGASESLGPVVAYTVIHYATFIALGVAAAMASSRARTEAGTMASFVGLFLVFEAGFYGLALLTPNAQLLTHLPWLQVGAANLVAATAMGVYMLRGHPERRAELTYALEGQE